MTGRKNDTDEKGAYEILIVDDEPQILNLLKETLTLVKDLDCEITLATSAEYGIKHIRERDYDMVMSDYQMPEMDGIEFLRKVKEESPGSVRFMITGQGDLKVAKRAINEADIDQYIEKPWDNEKLISTIREELVGKGDISKEEKSPVSSVDNVNDALDIVEAFQKKLTEEPTESFNKEKMMFEFDSNEQFNEFSFRIKNKRNIAIEDVNIFENKYVVTVGVHPKSYGKII
ncbi:MAG: response regulator [Thermoplasmata archaeon]